MKYLNNMAIFTLVVERGSISAAAEELSLSKSVVSQHLKNLEVELGVTLLQRTTRRQVLTPAGEGFFQRCQQITQLATEAWDEARESLTSPKGKISITAPHALISPIVAPAIGQLVAQYPDIHPTLTINDQRLDLIQHGIDLAIRVGESADSNYRQRKIGQFRDVLCASPHYIQRYLSDNKGSSLPVDSTEVSTEASKVIEISNTLPYVMNRWQGHKIRHQMTHTAGDKALDLSFNASCETDSIAGALALIEAGAGLGLIPDFIFQKYQKDNRLVSVLPDYHLPSIPVYAVHAYSQQAPMLVRICMDAVEKELQQVILL